MPTDVNEAVVLTHIEVVGDIDAFRAAWRAWIDAHVLNADGLIDATAHEERTGRRLLLIQRWRSAAAHDAWAQSEGARSAEALFATHAVRSATSRWGPLNSGGPA